MRIRCPECDFERDIDTTKIPATATVATCPRCTHRFRFRDPETGASVLEMEAAQQKAAAAHTAPASETPADPEKTASVAVNPAPVVPTAHPDDDPLPPGAIIPHLGQPEQQPGHPPRQSQDLVDDTDRNAAANAARSVEKPEKRPFFSAKNAGDAADPEQAPNKGKMPPWLTPNQNKGNGDSGQSADGFDGVPWEHPEHFGFLGSLLQTILRVMFRAPEFFRNIRSSAPLTKAIVFFLLLSVMDVLIYRMWAINALQSLSETVTDPAVISSLQEMVPSSGGDILTLLLFTPFLALFRLFFFAGLYHIMIRLVQPDKADFATVVRVIAYSSGTYVLSVVPVVGSMLGSLWFVASTFIGCKFALNLSWSKVTLALLPLFLLAGAVMIQVSRALMAGMAGMTGF